MRLLVTGGAGFIGSHVVDHAVDAGHEVVVIDRREPVPGVTNPAARYLVGDLTSESLAREAVAGVDAVSHQAARVGLEQGAADAAGYVLDNDLATARLLAALTEVGFDGRLVLASSMVVYGEGRFGCEHHGDVRPPPRTRERLSAGRFEPQCPQCGSDLVAREIDEGDALEPRNVYAATKLHQEHLGSALARLGGFEVVSLRYHNVYGPRMPLDTPYSGVAARFRSALTRGMAPRVFEDGAQRRDFVHVHDVARANLVAVAASGVEGAFNVASGQVRTVGDMAEALARAMGALPGQQPVVTGEFREGDVRHIVASPARAAAVLGFRARVDFEDGMAELAAEGAGPT